MTFVSKNESTKYPKSLFSKNTHDQYFGIFVTRRLFSTLVSTVNVISSVIVKAHK